MKIFIWQRVEYATDNWHTEGGIAAIAPDIEAARDLVKAECFEGCEALTTAPDFIAETDAPEPKIFVFKDAGCC